MGMCSITIWDRLTQIFDLFAVGCFISNMSVRFWLIYFDINYNVLLANGTWKGMIDQSWNVEDNFFIKYRRTLGNIAWLIKFLWIDILIILMIAIFIAVEEVAQIMAIIYLIFYIFFFVIYYNIWAIWIMSRYV